MSAPGTAIVGAGLMGCWHARYAARLGARIRGVVDLDPAAARRLAARFPGARAFGSLEECLAAGGVDAVHVCTGAASHAKLAEAALRAGRHVLVEKPAALTESEARRLLDAASEAGRVLAPAHQFPLQRGALWLSRRKDDLGALVRIDFATCSAGGEGRDVPARRALLLEILPHPLSLFRGLCAGEVDPGSWQVLRSTDDELSLRGLCSDTELGVTISLRGRPPLNELTVIGTRATARLDLYHGYGFLARAGIGRAEKLLGPFRRGMGQLAAASANLVWRAVRREAAFPGLLELIRRFHGAIRGASLRTPAPEEILEAGLLIERVGGLQARVAGPA